MKILASLSFAFLLLPLFAAQAMAAPLPERVSEFQPAKAPEGARHLCRNYPWACGAEAATPLRQEADIASAVREVNLSVNRQVRPARDRDNYGMAENWTLPAGNRGDCEDYALLKKKLLIERGVPADKLLLAVVVNNGLEPHVVLLFRGEDADYLLDNMTDAVLPWRLSGYTVVKMQSAADQTAWSAVLLGPLATREHATRTASWQASEERQIAESGPSNSASGSAAGRRHY